MEEIEYEFENLPMLPFSVYFVSQDGEISPKEMYTVSRKRSDGSKSGFEVYLCEVEKVHGLERIPVYTYS